jgi:hypothetical protein
MNVLAFIIRDVNYVFNDVKTFARLRQVSKLIYRLVCAANIRFTIEKQRSGTDVVTVVDVQGNKYYSTYTLDIMDHIVINRFAYRTLGECRYKYYNDKLDVICYRTKVDDREYRCHVYPSTSSGMQITIREYKNGKRTNRDEVDLAPHDTYTDHDNRVVYEHSYMLKWMADAPL